MDEKLNMRQQSLLTVWKTNCYRDCIKKGVASWEREGIVPLLCLLEASAGVLLARDVLHAPSLGSIQSQVGWPDLVGRSSVNARGVRA